MSMISRLPLRRSFAAVMAIALPVSVAGCFDNSEALLPLAAACDGGGVPEAADYDPKGAEQPAVAIAKEGDVLTVRNDFLGSGPKVAGDVASAQVVMCVYPGTPTKAETCRYIGVRSTSIVRQERTANIKLVAAKTGQVLGGKTVSAVALPCPETVSVRQGSEPEDQVYSADAALTTAIADWAPGAIAEAQPQAATVGESQSPTAATGDPVQDAAPVTSAPPIRTDASADAGDITAQCEALDDATDTDFGHGFGAQLAASNATLDLTKDDISVKVAVKLGVENMEEELQSIEVAIKTLRDAPLAEPELLEFRNQFLSGLTVMKSNLETFQTLVQAAKPHAEKRPVARGDLEVIASKMPPISEALTQQSKDLQEVRNNLYGRCLRLKQS